MRIKGEILILIGSLMLMFSSIVTFGFNFEDDLENIIFYRGILLGSLFVYIGGGIIIKNQTIKNVMISLGSGAISLITISTFNLFYDNLVNVNYYFYSTITVVSLTLIILTIMKIWSIKQKTIYMKY